MKKTFLSLCATGSFLFLYSAPAFELRVWPEKLHVKPGQVQEITVSVDKLPDGAASAEVECVVETGIAKRVLRKTGTVSPGSPMRFEFTPKRDWGYEVKATAKAGGESATASEVFACAENVYAIAPDYGGAVMAVLDTLPDGTPNPDGEPPYDKGVRDNIERMLALDRREYIPIAEITVSWCSFSAIKPAQSNYFVGGGYRFSTNINRYYIQKAHETGISVVTYVNACLKGPAGTEFAREHPEYLAYQPSGIPYADVFLENYRAHKEFIKTYPESLKRLAKDPKLMDFLNSGYPGFLNVSVDFEDPAVAKFGADALLDGVRYFGLDGIRFDGLYQVPSIGDPLAPSWDMRNVLGEKQKTGKTGEDLTLRNFKILFETLKKGKPDILIGMNWASFRPDQGMDVPEKAPINKALSPGMWILDEVAKGTLEPTSPTYQWDGFVKIMTRQADSTRKVGDYLTSGWGGGAGHNEVDTKEVKSFGFACGTRWVRGGWNRNPVTREVARTWNRLAMRYSEFILNNGLRRVPKAEAEKLIRVESDRPVYWSDFVYRLSNESGTYLVLNLVNKPVEDFNTVKAQQPPSARNVRLSISPAAFKKGKPVTGEVAVLDPENPPVLKGAASMKDGKLVIQIPETAYWKVVVIPIAIYNSTTCLPLITIFEHGGRRLPGMTTPGCRWIWNAHIS